MLGDINEHYQYYYATRGEYDVFVLESLPTISDIDSCCAQTRVKIFPH